MRRYAVFLLFVLALLVPMPSHAFCGFYVQPALDTGTPLFNDATRVALMRVGMRTVLSIQNDYQGPLENFALVVPVPIVLERENVRTLPRSIFDQVDRQTAPRMVEYWERDPCWNAHQSDDREGGTGARAKGEEGSLGNSTQKKALVTVEREFSVDEYDVVVLSARDSGALETWLRENKYAIPPGAEPYLRPYIQDGSKFFVAKVDITRVKFRWGRAQLSPLRFHYDTPQFTLPVRLGLINSSGVQDLVVYLLGPERFETANYENLTIPTNLTVKSEVRAKFNSFYGALFDQTVANHPHAVVTEYAWAPSSCGQPCSLGATGLAPADIDMLGGDVIAPRPASLVLTRLHARYGKATLGDDIVFRAAKPIEGGLERMDRHDAASSETNTFQARYAIRHAWSEDVSCERPQFGVWDVRSDLGQQVRRPPAFNPRADRNLKVADYIDQGAEHRATNPPRHGVFWHILSVDDWDSADRFLALSTSSGVVLVVLLAVARRRRAVLMSVGIFALVCVFGYAIGCASDARDSLRHILARPFTYAPLALFGLVVAAAGIAISRTRTRLLWAAFPGVLSLIEAVHLMFWSKQFWAEALADETMTIDRMARIAAEMTSETYETIVIGCAMSGALFIGVAWLMHSKVRAARLGPAIGAAVITILAHVFLPREHLVMTAVAVGGAVGAVFLVARCDRFGDILAAATGTLLLDVCGRLEAMSQILDSTTRESIDTWRVGPLLEIGVADDRRWLLLCALDLALIAGVAFLAKRPRSFVDWRLLTAAGLLVLLPATAFEWLGFRARFLSIDPERSRTEMLAGPALYIEGSSLRGSAGTELPARYDASVAAKMAAAENGSPPLLFARPERSLGEVFATLAPLLDQKQVDYQLIANPESPPALGAYGVILKTREMEPFPIEISRAVTLVDGAPPARGRLFGTVFHLEGDKFGVREYEIDKAGIRKAPGPFPFASTLDLAVDEYHRDFLEGQLKRGQMMDEALLLVPVETTVAKLAGVLSKLGKFHFPRIVVSTDMKAYDRL